TRPWTLPANRAIVLPPDLPYTTVPTGRRPDEVYLVARGRARPFLEAVGLPVDEESWIDLLPARVRALEGARYAHPFVESDNPNVFRLWFAQHVTLEAGTGLVHTAPGHGDEDYVVGKELDLPIDAPADVRGP